MEITITEKKDQPLLSRQEILGKVTFSGVTPSKDNFRKELAKKLNAKEELLIVKKMDMIYGNQAAYFTAMSYKKKEDMQVIEHDHMLKKNFKKAESKDAEKSEDSEATAEDKKSEEAPAKEKKADAPKE